MGIPTCKEVHRLASEKQDRPLNLTEKLRMHGHLLACDACRTFNAQLAVMRKAMRGLPAINSTEKKVDEL